MLQTLSQLPPVHQGYLIAVIGAFCAFGITLASVHILTNLPDRRR